ncbi:MAG: hypothetical protein WCS90_02545 [Bacilli bacterium]
MNPLKKIIPLVCLIISAGALAGCQKNNAGNDVYTEDGKLKISMRNLYFESWAGGDVYTDTIQDKFKVAITPSTYSYNDWTSQVSAAVNAGNLTDVFQFNITQFNFANSYKFWAEGQVIKALPDDLSAWPNLKSLIDNTTDIDSLKIDGHLYGLPIAKNIAEPKVNYSPFTYVYRRDWAKKWGVYQDNDVYTWDQFTNLINTFNTKLNPTGNADKYAMADVEWGFPSLTNFYKQVPHCFAFDETAKKYVGNFATDAYVQGMDLAKQYVDSKIYGYDQYNATEGGARKAYESNNCGVFYENLSLANYQAIRAALSTANTIDANFKVDDAAAIMKVKGPDGKFALEGTDNWFSMSLFNYDISDTKMKKILDLLDYLLSEEGTKLAVYGKAGYDYTEDGDGGITLTENGWPIGDDGKYVAKTNGAKYLRYVATLGSDYAVNDPLTDKAAYAVVSSWDKEMSEAAAASTLRVLKENPEVMWLSTKLKDTYEGALLENANDEVVRYCYGKDNKAAYLSSVTGGQWPGVLTEVNKKLGYII